MGIKDLIKFIREKFPSAIDHCDISSFSERTITVDTSGYIYRYKARYGNDFLNGFIPLLCVFKKYNLHAIFIFDGEPPSAKNKVKIQRSEARNKLQQNINIIKQHLNEYKQTGSASELLKKTAQTAQTYTGATSRRIRYVFDKHQQIGNVPVQSSSSFPSSPVCETPFSLNEHSMKSFLERKQRQVIHIDKNDINKIKTLLHGFGFPFIATQYGEAEAIASYLTCNGYSDAVLTDDGDVLAYGACIFLSNLGLQDHKCRKIHYENVLSHTGFTKQEFVDFCILCGTDYNENIKKLGPVAAYNLIQNYKQIEHVLKALYEQKKYKYNKEDIESFEYATARNIFNTFGIHERYLHHLQQHMPLARCNYHKTYFEIQQTIEELNISMPYVNDDVQLLWNILYVHCHVDKFANVCITFSFSFNTCV